MKYLIDTNIWLELLLEQEKAAEVRLFLERIEPSHMAITDFTLHSIALILVRLKKNDLFLQFLADVIEDSAVTLVRLKPSELAAVIAVISQTSLDFDDAYQYAAADVIAGIEVENPKKENDQ